MSSYVLLLDDEQGIINALQRIILRRFHVQPGAFTPMKLISFTNPVLALDYVRHHTLDLIISDYRMPQMNGLDFLKCCREIQPDTARMIISGFTDYDALIEAINKVRIDYFIPKPWNEEEILEVIGHALARHKKQQETNRLADDMRLREGLVSLQEVEKMRLELLEPGLTKVNWGPDGSVHLEKD